MILPNVLVDVDEEYIGVPTNVLVEYSVGTDVTSCMSSVISAPHPANADDPIVLHAGIRTYERLRHPPNAFVPIDVHAGKNIDPTLEQDAKPYPLTASQSGRLTVLISLQYANAYAPTSVHTGASTAVSPQR